VPIKAENRSRYPKDWKLISSYIRRVRALGKCEWCGVKNGARGARDRHGEWWDEVSIENLNSGVGMELFGDFPKIIRIVLTVMHLDHNPENNDRQNLKAACQACHLRYDHKHHMANARVTRNSKRGQESLFS